MLSDSKPVWKEQMYHGVVPNGLRGWNKRMGISSFESAVSWKDKMRWCRSINTKEETLRRRSKERGGRGNCNKLKKTARRGWGVLRSGERKRQWLLWERLRCMAEQHLETLSKGNPNTSRREETPNYYRISRKRGSPHTHLPDIVYAARFSLCNTWNVYS